MPGCHRAVCVCVCVCDCKLHHHHHRLAHWDQGLLGPVDHHHHRLVVGWVCACSIMCPPTPPHCRMRGIMMACVCCLTTGTNPWPLPAATTTTGRRRTATRARRPTRRSTRPPADRARSHGLPTWSVVPPNANSCVCVCPTRTTARRAQPRPHDRVLARDVALEHPAPRCHRQPGDGVEVLQADRHAAEAAARPRPRALRRSSAARAIASRLLGVHARPRVDGFGRAVERLGHAARPRSDPG